MPSRESYFIKLSFRLFDSGVLALLSPKLVATYLAIQTFVWRSGNGPGDPAVLKLAKAGYLVAKVKQGKIAAMTGQTRSTVNRHIRTMKRLGWLKVIELSSGTVVAYMLGGWKQIQARREERFYFDAWLRRVWAELEAHATAKLSDDSRASRSKSNKKGTKTGSLVNSLEMPERIAVVQRILEKQGVPLRRRYMSPGRDRTDTGDVTTEAQGPVVYGAQGCDGTSTIEGVESEEEENLVERENLRVGAARTTRPTPETLDSGPPSELQDTEDSPRPRDMAGLSSGAANGDRLSSEPEPSDDELWDDDYAQFQVEQEDIERCEHAWLAAVRPLWPDMQLPGWGGKERGQCRQLLLMYRSVEVVERALVYLATEWMQIEDRLFHGKGSFPTVGLLLRQHDLLVPEAETCADAFAAIREAEAWDESHPDDDYPDDLRDRLRRGDAALERANISFYALTGLIER